MKFGSLRPRASLVVALSVVALVALSAPVQAATPRAAAAPSSVSLVAGVNDPKDPNIAVLEYLPAKVKVATGTTVTWNIAGPEPHSVTFVPPGTTVPPSTQADPSLTFPTPATAPYDGTTLVNSGVLPLGATTEVQKFSMSFAKTGTYTYYCVLHPNMAGTITVTGDTQDSQQKITKTGNQEKAKYLKEGEAAKTKLLETKPKTTKNADGTSTYTVDMGASTPHTDVLTFAPSPRNVKTGDQVTFVNNSARAAHRQLRRPARAHHPDRRQRRAATTGSVAPGTGAGHLPQHRVAAAEDEERPPAGRPELHVLGAGARQVHLRVRPAPPERDGRRDRRRPDPRRSRPLAPSLTGSRARPRVLGQTAARYEEGTVMDRHERIEDQLAKVPLFSSLSKKELKLISQLATYLEEPAGTVLTEEGKPGHEFIIVLDGEIEVRQGGKVVAERGAGSYVGEIALLDHRPRTATVVAKTPVAIEVIGQREFAGLLAEVPELSQQLLATVARRLADLDQQQEPSA